MIDIHVPVGRQWLRLCLFLVHHQRTGMLCVFVYGGASISIKPE